MEAELSHNAAETSEFPSDGLPEVAVLGRSNVGKSTFINALVGRRGLARTSARPGKTRRIHFYRLARAAYLVDLPGYGYAAVSRDERRSWKPMVEAYLRGTRETLRGAILLVDARRGAELEERELLGWLAAQRISTRVVLTKCDKLKPSELAKCEREQLSTLGLSADALALVSGRTGQGLGRVAQWMRDWTGLGFTRPDGAPLR